MAAAGSHSKLPALRDETPALIRETFFAPPAPSQIATALEVSLSFSSSRRFSAALDVLKQCREEWIKLSNGEGLHYSVEVYFDLSIGSIEESSGNDAEAYTHYTQALSRAQQNKADGALIGMIQSCLGCVLHHLLDFKKARDWFLKSSANREAVLGPDSVDVAASLNNLAASFLCLTEEEGAATAALEHAKRAATIFADVLGPDHPRTQCAKRNLLLSRRRSMREMVLTPPVFTPMSLAFNSLFVSGKYSAGIEDGGDKKKKKKKKGGKKKKK